MCVRYRSSRRGFPRWLAVAATVSLLSTGVATRLEAAPCGPFTDVDDTDLFCPSILEIYYLGITAGTSPNTFGPTLPVTRQMLAAMLAHGPSGATSARGSRRPALDQFWTAKVFPSLSLGYLGVDNFFPRRCKADGADVWVTHPSSGRVSRVRASDNRVLEAWTGATAAEGVLPAMGLVFVTGSTSPGTLYAFDPGEAPGAVTVVTVSSPLGGNPNSLAFDGTAIWTANTDGSVSRVAPGSTFPWSNLTVAGYGTPYGILYDGTNIWITDTAGGRLLKLSGHAIEQIVTVGANPSHPAFDGTNIWVPNFGSDSVTVVRASSGAVLATLTGNGLSFPRSAAFDGERILVAGEGESVSTWRAADLVALGSVATGGSSAPYGACSDGISFWVTLQGLHELARF